MYCTYVLIIPTTPVCLLFSTAIPTSLFNFKQLFFILVYIICIGGRRRERERERERERKRERENLTICTTCANVYMFQSNTHTHIHISYSHYITTIAVCIYCHVYFFRCSAMLLSKYINTPFFLMAR